MPHPILDLGALSRFWNRCAPAHPLDPVLLEEVTVRDPSFQEDDVLAIWDGDRLAGFALAKRLRRPCLGCERFMAEGYVSLLAVDPACRRRGLGGTLLARAEDHLRAGGATRVVVGGSFHHALAAIPAALDGGGAFFAACGYELSDRTVWDVARDVRHFDVPDRVGEDLARAGVEARIVGTRFGASFEPEDSAALLEFLTSEFPGRWYRDVGLALGRPDALALVVTLFRGMQAVGFAQLHLPGSPGAARWVGFDPDVAAIGPVGIATAWQGRGLGLAVVALAADHLRRMGAHRVVIDWTDLVAFYGRLGFEPWLSYVPAQKTL